MNWQLGGGPIVRAVVLRNSRTTDSLGAPKSAEFLFPLVPRPAACALLSAEFIRQLRLLCVCIGLVLSPCAVLQASTAPPLEYQVKAAFLLNFTKFVDWPASRFPDSSSPIVICIVGEDPFGQTLDQIVEGETVNGRKIVLQRIGRDVPRTCQVAFVSGSERNVSKILPGLGPGVLTVGEAADFLKEGGMIAFVIENRRVRFDINQAAADVAGLKLSSKLLNVARSVEK